MAVWGIGAYYDEDKSYDFISSGVACLGWSKQDAQPLHSMFLTTLYTKNLMKVSYNL